MTTFPFLTIAKRFQRPYRRVLELASLVRIENGCAHGHMPFRDVTPAIAMAITNAALNEWHRRRPVERLEKARRQYLIASAGLADVRSRGLSSTAIRDGEQRVLAALDDLIAAQRAQAMEWKPQPDHALGGLRRYRR